MSEDPLFRVVRGVPTPEELAALVGVLTVRLRPGPSVAVPPVSYWVRSSRPSPGGPGRGAWRSSGLPR